LRLVPVKERLLNFDDKAGLEADVPEILDRWRNSA
jgi:hypothetical protein